MNEQDEPKSKQPPAAEAKKDTPAILGLGTSSKNENSGLKLFNSLFLILMSVFFGFLGGWVGSQSQKNNSNTTVEHQKVVMSEQADVISGIAKEVGQSVVSVNVTSQSSSGMGFYDLFYGSQQQQSAGTGIIISEDGIIMTNRHVVPAGTTDVSVVLADGTTLNNVKVIGRTNNSDSLDIAFLKISDAKGKKLHAAKLGDSGKMVVGDQVVAIGNALGQFQNTVTTGIISAYGRSLQAGDESGGSLENLDDLFQTDAAINQGNSGGPLVNLNGEVIGINTAIAGDAQNIGFAIPINNVKGLINSVKTKGKLERPYLGVVYVAVTDDIAKKYDLKVNRGAFIPRSEDLGRQSIAADSPADKSGLKGGDVITKVGDQAIDEHNSLTSVLAKYAVGDKVTLTVQRGSDQVEISVELGVMPTSSQQ